eukprot:CFRG4429T1
MMAGKRIMNWIGICVGNYGDQSADHPSNTRTQEQSQTRRTGRFSSTVTAPNFNLSNNTNCNKSRDFKQLLKEYQVVRRLCGGSTAEVFIAQEVNTGRYVIIKEQLLEKCERSNLDKEISIHSRLNHPNIVELIATSQNQKVTVLVQEYLPGGELFDAVTPDVGMNENKVRIFMKQLVEAIKYLHDSGVAHRDVKPENIVLDKSKNIVKLIDFGLSDQVSKDPQATYKRHVGTIPYMAPELLRNVGRTHVEIDIKATDVWALGIVMYCMLFGRFPWSKANNNSKEFRNYVSKGEEFQASRSWTKVDETDVVLLRRMLDINPNTRWTIHEAKNYIQCVWQTKRWTPTIEIDAECDFSTDSGYESMNVSNITLQSI